MKAVDEGIISKFTALNDLSERNSFYTSVSGKLYKGRAPQNATLPYAVFNLISDVPEWTFNTDFVRMRYQFDLYSSNNSSVEVENMYTYLNTLFDWCSLAVDGHDHVHMKRELARLTRDPEDDNWHYIVDFEIFEENQTTR
jgi:hypothetical protein